MFSEYHNNKLLGYPGGVLQQPDTYWSDIATMRALMLWDEHVKDLPRMEQKSVFDQIKETGTLSGTWQTTSE
jgi:hypothetical protein